MGWGDGTKDGLRNKPEIMKKLSWFKTKPDFKQFIQFDTLIWAGFVKLRSPGACS